MRLALLASLVLSAPATALEVFSSEAERLPCSEQAGGNPHFNPDPSLAYFPAVNHLGNLCVGLSATLRGMNELPLHSEAGETSVRVLWSRSFMHPMVFRADIHDPQNAAIIWRLGKGMGLATQFDRGDGRTLVESEINLLQEVIDSAQICHRPNNHRLVADGDLILIETSDDELYCFNYEANPPDGPRRRLLGLMIRLSGANPDDAIPNHEL